MLLLYTLYQVWITRWGSVEPSTLCWNTERRTTARCNHSHYLFSSLITSCNLFSPLITYSLIAYSRITFSLITSSLITSSLITSSLITYSRITFSLPLYNHLAPLIQLPGVPHREGRPRAQVHVCDDERSEDNSWGSRFFARIRRYLAASFNEPTIRL